MKVLDIETLLSDAMNRVTQNIERSARIIRNNWRNQAIRNQVMDNLLGGPLCLNRSRVAKLADKMILENI